MVRSERVQERRYCTAQLRLRHNRFLGGTPKHTLFALSPQCWRLQRAEGLHSRADLISGNVGTSERNAIFPGLARPSNRIPRTTVLYNPRYRTLLLRICYILQRCRHHFLNFITQVGCQLNTVLSLASTCMSRYFLLQFSSGLTLPLRFSREHSLQR